MSTSAAKHVLPSDPAEACVYVIDHAGPYMLNLLDRWDDEHMYEDWSDYVAAAKRKLAEIGVRPTGVRLTQNFDLTFNVRGERKGWHGWWWVRWSLKFDRNGTVTHKCLGHVHASNVVTVR